MEFPELVTPDVYSKLLNEDVVTSDAADRFFQVGYFATPKEMEELVEGQGFKRVSHIATDTFTLLGSSNHGLVIAQC
ncbi:hypothetical protein [Vibrio tritonius]|uniref:hypothetical protein n=1 Tax=Vibrio tritonius TaxID=1435069 RepID=UPI00315C7A9A